MASFKTHVAGGVFVGAVFSAISYYSFDLDIIQSFAIFNIGLISAIIPDLDSDSGKPVALISGIISVLIPALLLSKVNSEHAGSAEFLISYFAFFYLLINYVVCGLIKKMSTHRGIMHSIPFSLLWAEFFYLLFNTSNQTMATMAALVTFCGCLIHLILDELNAIYFRFYMIPMLKKSSGTALKLFSSDLGANLLVYGLLFMTTAFIFLN